MHDDPKLPDIFDRSLGAIVGLPGGMEAGPAQVQTSVPVLGNVETWTVQTIRVPEHGETVFLQVLSADRAFRLVVPPKVTAVLQRQHDAITARLRSRSARRVAQERKAAGIPPGFMKNPHRGPGARTRSQKRKRVKA